MNLTDPTIIAAARMLTAAVAELEAAKAAVASEAPGPFGHRDIRFERVIEARQEVEAQLRNVKACCHYSSVG